MNSPVSAHADVQARIARLFVYPIKSCAGVELSEALLTETGLDLDRAWMVVDSEGEFLTQREAPRMALIQPAFKRGGTELQLRAPGMLALHLLVDAVEAPTRVRVWNDVVPAYDMGDIAAQWFTDFLGLNARLQAQGHGPVDIRRFRPNIVLEGLEAHDEDRVGPLQIATAEGAVVLTPVKPCPRCPIPNIDPDTAQSSPEVNDTLQGYRQDARVNGALTFGMNAIVTAGVDQVLRVGQSVSASYRFD